MNPSPMNNQPRRASKRMPPPQTISATLRLILEEGLKRRDSEVGWVVDWAAGSRPPGPTMRTAKSKGTPPTMWTLKLVTALSGFQLRYLKGSISIH